MKKYLLPVITGIFFLTISISRLQAVKETDTSLYYNIGLLKTIQNNYPQAINAYCMAVRTEKSNPEIYLNLAEVCLKFINDQSSDMIQNRASIDKYYSLGMVSIRMTDQLLTDYRSGKTINLFTRSMTAEKVIKSLEIRLSNLRTLYNKFNDKMQAGQKGSVNTVSSTLKKRSKPDNQNSEKKAKQADPVNITENKPEQSAVAAADSLINTYLLTNNSINNDREHYSREITDLKKELIDMIKVYMEQSGDEQEKTEKKDLELQKKIISLKQQIYQMEKEYQEQIAVLKQKISESEKKNKTGSSEDEDDKKSSKGILNNVFFGGLIVVTLLMVAII